MTLPPAAAPYPLGSHLCFSVYAASHALIRAYRPLLEPLGVTYPQYLVLLVLWERDGRSVSEIGAELGLDSGTLTPLLKRMDTAGLIHRARDTDDERRVTVRLTADGEALREKAASIPGALACSMRLSTAEIRDLKSAVDRLRDGLAASEEDGAVPSPLPLVPDTRDDRRILD